MVFTCVVGGQGCRLLSMYLIISSHPIKKPTGVYPSRFWAVACQAGPLCAVCVELLC